METQPIPDVKFNAAINELYIDVLNNVSLTLNALLAAKLLMIATNIEEALLFCNNVDEIQKAIIQLARQVFKLLELACRVQNRTRPSAESLKAACQIKKHLERLEE